MDEEIRGELDSTYRITVMDPIGKMVASPRNSNSPGHFTFFQRRHQKAKQKSIFLYFHLVA
jgi:hypothetical protein